MTREEFNNQSLPKSDVNSNLETLSRTRLRELFGVKDFELRDEHESDRGIDLFIEIKANGNHTNLRFPVQLKATSSSKPNQGGSISLSIKVANINYLMNDGLPAFYVLYHQPSDAFYYERAIEVDTKLREKYPDGSFPESYSIRFNKVLDVVVIQSIHEEMLSLGLLRRNLTSAFKLTRDGSILHETLVIQKDQQVYSATERARFLEKYGYRLLNEARFQAVINIEQTCYPLEDVSAAFHFVCGTAYYYTSQLYKALDHFKLAQKNKTGLQPEIQNMLKFYMAQSKRALNIIDAEKTSGYVEALMDSEYLGLHLKLQKAFETYYCSTEPDQVKLKMFQDIIDMVIADPRCDDSLALIAESYVLSIEGHRLNEHLVNYLLLTRDSLENPLIDPSQYKPRQDQIDHYNGHFKALKQKALAHKNQYTYNIICLNGIKVQYIQSFYVDIILGVDKKTLTVHSLLNEGDLSILAEQASLVGKIADVYQQLNSIDNAVAALSQQYELLHFMRDFTQAGSVMKKMEKLVAEYDLHGLEAKVEILKNGGTGHETFASMVLGSLSKAGERHNKAVQLSDEINQMDLEDKERPFSITEQTCQLQLIPFGFFCFERAVLDDVFEVIRTTEKAKQGILHLMKMGIMPVVNIYNDPIVTEGPAGGEYDNKGLLSLEHIHNIRKELRKLGAYKVFPRFGS